MKVSVIIPVFNQEELIVRCLNSIPKNDELEIIIVSDGSTDKTVENVLEFKRNNIERKMKTICRHENKGVGYSINEGLSWAKGKYYVLIGSDDYFLPSLPMVIDELDGTDLVYFDMINNLDEYYRMSPDNRELHVGSVKFIRKDFIKDLRYPELRAAEDAGFMHELVKLNPTEKYTGIVAKHYNYPREGSLSWLHERGQI